MDFKREYRDEILTISVNLKRATFLEANSFNEILVEEIGNGYRKFVVDLSSCSFVDPIFIGVIIMTLKKLTALKGSLKIIIPEIGFNLEKNTINSLRVFETYQSKNAALESFKKKIIIQYEESNHVMGMPPLEASFSV